jgi:hypothetical protein
MRSPNGRDPAYVIYRCHASRYVPGHTRPYSVPEHLILPWIKEEAGRLRTPERVQLAEKNAAARANLEARRLRVLDLYEAGHIETSDRDRRLAAVADELAKIETAERLVEVPELDWSWPADRVNGVLRAIWEHVQLDQAMRPSTAQWLVPKWRTA